MKPSTRLTFAPENNRHCGAQYSSAHYQTDWSTGDQWVAPTTYLRVLRGGCVQLTSNLRGCPDGRREALTQFDVDIRRHAELPAVYLPGTGQRVARSQLSRDWVYLVEREHNQVLALRARSRGAFVQWTMPHMAGRTQAGIPVVIYDAEAQKRWWVEHGQLQAVLDGVWALGDVNRAAWSDYHTLNRLHRARADSTQLFYKLKVKSVLEWLRAPDMTDIDMLQKLAWLTHAPTIQTISLRWMAKAMTARQIEVTHLALRPEGVKL